MIAVLAIGWITLGICAVRLIYWHTHQLYPNVPLDAFECVLMALMLAGGPLSLLVAFVFYVVEESCK